MATTRFLHWLGGAVRDTPRGTPLSLIDVGCGYGDLLRAVSRWSRRRDLDLTLVGIDLNPETIRIVRAATDAADRIDFRVMNVFEIGSDMPVDLIVSSLVAHHLPDRQISDFLRLMQRVARRAGRSAICNAAGSYITSSASAAGSRDFTL